MKAARVFLNPDAKRWIDFPMPENASLMQWWAQVTIEGCCVSAGAVAPYATIHHVLQLEAPDTTTTLTVFPGGKPN